MKKEFLRKFVKVIPIFIVVLTCLMLSIYAENNDKVQLSVNTKKKIEVVLSKDQSNMDTSNFKENVYQKLEDLGVDRQSVEFYDVEREEMSTEAENAATIFNSWNKAGVNLQWVYDEANQTISNPYNDDNMSGYYYPGGYDFQDSTMKFQAMGTDGWDDDIIGGMIRFKPVGDDKYTGYILYVAGGPGGWPTNQSGLYKIENASFNSNNITLLARIEAYWSRNWDEFQIEAKGNNIKVYINDELKLDYVDEDPIYEGSYGFFSQSNVSGFKNINVENGRYNSFDGILLKSTFNDNDIHAVINIKDKEEVEFKNAVTLGTILSRTINQGIHYIGLGTDENKNQTEEFIRKNNNKGIYIDNTNYDEAVEQTAQYIKSLLDQYSSNSEYMILGEDNKLQVTPSELQTNTADNEYKNGKWKIYHNHTYFENNIGQYENSGKYISDLPETLDKVGQYKIEYEDVQIEPEYIYVHRRPIAVMDLNRSGNTLNLSESRSYDLDNYSINNGIQNSEWSYKEIDDEEWTQGKLKTIEDGKEYIVRLRVQDYQNAWSEYTTKYVTLQENVNPIAEYLMVNKSITKYEELNIIDNSYDPSGKALSKYEWTIYKDGNEVYKGSELITNYNTEELGVGEYELALKVTNSENIESDEFKKSFTVKDDEIAPDIIVDSREGETINEDQHITFSFIDEGGSGFKNYKYAIVDNDEEQEENINWSDEIEETTGELTIKEYGDNYIYIKTIDNAGNEKIIKLGNYHIEKKEIQIKIENIDSENEDTKLSDAKFKIGNEEVITDENGEGSLNILTRTEGTYEYEVEETVVPVKYIRLESAPINIIFDSNWKVTNVESTSDYIEVKKIESEKIELIIKNDKKLPAEINLSIAKNEEDNNVSLNWDIINAYDDEYEYKVYSQGDGSDEYTTVGTNDYESGDKIKVLNVYPNTGNTLKTWMETNGFGRGLILVDPVSISEFNSNPSQYLGNPDNWNYDVIMFGTWDSNNGCDISVSARDLTEEFIKDGRGAIFGHDTLGNDVSHPNFTSLAGYLNMTMGAPWSVSTGNSQVIITKKGIFTSFPWNIGEIGDVLNIPWSHHLDQYAHGEIWLKFKDRTDDNFYLTTWNNCAMIQTGHSSGAATEDEQKIIANLIGFVKQTTTKTYAKDYAGMDVNPPDALQNVQTDFNDDGDLEVTFDNVKDNGSKYSYYVEGRNKTTKETIQSNIEETEIIAGLKGYSYVIDNNETIESDFFKGREVVENNKVIVSDIDMTKGTYLHIAAVDNADNVSEVSNIKLQFIYKTKVEIVSELNNEEKIPNALVHITTKNENGEIISEQEGLTDNNGLVEIKHNLEVDTILTHEIMVKGAPIPYLADRGIVIEVHVDTTGNITGVNTENNQQLDINNINKSIICTIDLENKKIPVEIEKVDASNENIKLDGAKIKIGDEEIVTKGSGKGTLNILAKSEGIYEYNIEETSAPVGYSSLESVPLRVEYDSNGDVKDVQVSNENIQIVNYSAEKIQLKVKNTKVEQQGYNLVVQAIDKSDENIKVKGAKYKISIIAESGENIELEETTNEEGNIQINNLATKGETQIRITPTQAGKGYKKSSDTAELVLTRSVDGIISIVENRTRGDIEGVIKNNEELIIKMLNERKDNENSIELDVEDKNDNTLKIENLKFTLKLPYGLGEREGTTNEEGLLRFENIESLGKGDYIYIIEPENNNEYNLSQIKIIVGFDENGKITRIEEVTEQINEIKIEEEESEEKINTIGKLKIQASTLEDGEQVETQKIKIIKQDKNTGERLQGIQYKIKQITDTSIKSKIYTTDSFGEIDLNISKVDEVELRLKEVKTISKYILDKTEKKITLKLNKSTGKLEVKDSKTDDTVQYELDEDGNIIIIETAEKKIDTEREEGKANISFFITKQDKNNRLLGNVQFGLIETTTGRSYTLHTDANGYVELLDFAIPDEGSYEFYITEANTVTGYDPLLAPIKISITYEKYEGEMKASSIIVSRGYKWIIDKECYQYETEDTYQLDMNLLIKNLNVESSDFCEFEISKLDKDGGQQNLIGAKYDVLFEFEDGTTIKQQIETSRENSVIDKIEIPVNEEVNITFTEVEAPIGYKKEDKIYKVTRLSNGQLQIINKQSQNDYVENNNVICLALLDEKQKSGEEDGPTGIISIEDETGDNGYNVIVKNNNINNDKLRLEGSIFNVQVEKDGDVKYNSSRGLGRYNSYNQIYYGGIKIDGTQEIIIKQTIAPLHHIINDEEYRINIKRDSETGTIELINKNSDNIDVKINGETITAIINNEPAEIMLAIKKVDEENNEIQLSNAVFTFGKYYDYSTADLRTRGYLNTENEGIGYCMVSPYVTDGTALYTISEEKAPEGYYPNGTIGLYMTLDRNGDIVSASTVENSYIFDSGKAYIDKIDGKYIEIRVINKRNPEPRYSLVIENENSYDKDVKIGGSVFDVELNEETGLYMNKELTTGGDGKAYVQGLTGKGNIKIKITQTKGSDTYKIDETVREIELDRKVIQTVTTEEGNTYAKNITLNSKIPSDTDVIIDNEKQEIKVKIYNERKYGIEIKKVDSGDREILLPNAVFGIYEAENKIGEIVTNEIGRGFLDLGDSPINTVKTYTIVEETAPESYSKIDNGILTISFNEAGEITYAYVEGTNNISVDYRSKGYIKLEVDEEHEIDDGEGGESTSENKETYSSFRIIKENYNNEKLNIGKVVFDIHTIAEDGREVRAIKTTNDKGKIELSNNIPGDKVTIKLKEVETAKGYVLDDKERTIVFEKDSRGRLRLVEDQTSDDLDIRVDSIQRIIEVRIKNEISENYIGLAITKTDKDDELLTIQGAKYDIKDEETGDISEITTGYKGVGFILLDPKPEGTYTYKIKETQAPAGYELNNEIIELEVEFKEDEAGISKINTARIKNANNISAEINNQDTNYIEIQTKDEPEDNGIEEYDIEVIKVDRDDIETTLAGATLNINVVNSIGQTGLNKIETTKEDGKIEINGIKGAGDVTIDINELIAPKGRKFDAKTKTVKLTKSEINGRIELIESENVDTIISNKNKKVTILVRNEIIDGEYSIVLQAKDKFNNDIKLANTEFKVEIPGEEVKRVTTDENGRIELLNIGMPIEGTYTFKITQTKSKENYEKLDKPIKLQVTFGLVEIEEETEDGVHRMIVEGITSARVIQEEENSAIVNQQPKYIKLEIYNRSNMNYVIHYDANIPEGVTESAENIPEDQIEDGETAIINNENEYYAEPSLKGYLFKEWNTKADGTGTSYKHNDIYEGRQDLTLYAIWNYMIYYDSNLPVDEDGFVTTTVKKETMPETQYDKATSTKNMVVDDLKIYKNKPQAEGYEFLEWNTKADGTGDTYNPNDEYEGRMTIKLYAIWGYAIYYDSNIPKDKDGFPMTTVSNMPDTQYEAVNSTQNMIINDLNIYTETPKAEGYIFKEWNTEVDGTGDTYNPSDEYKDRKNVTLYAIWTTKEGKLYLRLKDNSKYEIGIENTREYEEGDKYISGLKPEFELDKKGTEIHRGTTVSEFISNIRTNATSIEVKMKDSILSEKDLIGTGATLTLTKDNESIEVKLSVIGDLSGDGKILIDDLSELLQAYKKKSKLSQYFADKFADNKLNLDPELLVISSDLTDDKKGAQIDDVSIMITIRGYATDNVDTGIQTLRLW